MRRARRAARAARARPRRRPRTRRRRKTTLSRGRAAGHVRDLQHPARGGRVAGRRRRARLHRSLVDEGLTRRRRSSRSSSCSTATRSSTCRPTTASTRSSTCCRSPAASPRSRCSRSCCRAGAGETRPGPSGGPRSAPPTPPGSTPTWPASTADRPADATTAVAGADHRPTSTGRAHPEQPQGARDHLARGERQRQPQRLAPLAMPSTNRLLQLTTQPSPSSFHNHTATPRPHRPYRNYRRFPWVVASDA